MALRLHISPRIIPSVASLYNDVNRIFMEYIDNSIDSAEAFFDADKNAYNKQIEINLTLEGSTSKDGRVFISDNCVGMAKLEKVVQNVGNSDKKAQPWTNGQFGYGIYSFMAACSKLEITTKLESNPSAFYIPINRTQFDEDRQEDVNFPDPKAVKKFSESGTQVCLSEFDKNSWKQVNILELKNEIEKHFELLLARKNLTITLRHQANNEDHVCEPFDYSQFDGEVYEETLRELSLNKGGEYEVKIAVDSPIHIYIKVTKGKTINKPPVFISKGRRIAEIKEVRSFKSNHKRDLWGHPNVTGYIDLSSYLEPTIARNDFKNNHNSKALYETLIGIEPAIFEIIKDVNKQSEDRHYQELEDRLNQALSKLAKLDNMNFRTDYITGTNINLQSGGEGTGVGVGEEGKDGSDVKSPVLDWIEGVFGSKDGGQEKISGDLPDDNPGQGPLNKEADNPFEDTGFAGNEKKKSGYNIRIVDNEPDIDSVTNKPYRSNIYGNEIRIFKQHPDFAERVKETVTGSKKITPRLITYLAGEVTVHYKDQLHNKKGQPEYNKNLFVDLVGSVYQIENLLSDLEGKNLSDLN